MSRRSRLLAVVSLVGLFLVAPSANAFLRARYEDCDVVERSELIVVGRLLPDSIKYIPNVENGKPTGSWRHEATLVVKQVLKGKTNKRRIPVTIHYGLMPVVGGSARRAGYSINLPRPKREFPRSLAVKLFGDRSISIIDTGNSAFSFEPLVEDARNNHLWFLRRLAPPYGREPGKGNYGIVDPEDLQPLELKNYFLTYLSNDPEKALRKYLKNNPDIDDRAQRQLDRLEAKRIGRIEDPAVRAEKMVAIFVRRFALPRWRAEKEVVACGEAAGPPLMALLKNPAHQSMRPAVIRLLGEIRYQPAAAYVLEKFDDRGFESSRLNCVDLWRNARYRPAVDVLIDLVEKQDAYWAGQKLKKGWWNDTSNQDLRRERHANYSLAHHAVMALGAIGDPRAIDAIERTRQRWLLIKFDTPQIVEACEKALRKLKGKPE